MDVRYADEVRDDLLVSMAWLDERRGVLTLPIKTGSAAVKGHVYSR